MKKILSFLLVATMLVAMFVMPSAAEDSVNYEAEFPFVDKAPKVDGTVKKGEYSALPLNSYPEDKSQFVDTEHNDFAEGDVEFDFYAAWDADYVYMAWVVDSESFGGMPEKDYNSDGKWDPNDVGDNGWMWQYSCIQFIFTPGAPKKGETSYQQQGAYAGDYLEVGLALTAEGQQVRACWNKPAAALSLEVNDWDAAIIRDGNVTTYEVRIPWGKSGLNSTGTGAKFGLTYAVAFQADYNVKKGMIEWQNGVLTSKDADSAAVITLTGGDIDETVISKEEPVPEKTEGTVPADAEGKTQLIIDGVNVGITAEKAYLYTDPSAINAQNTKWATNVLLAPVEGEEGTYAVKEVVVGAGEDIAFTTELTDGMLVYSAHSDGEGAGMDRKTAATNLAIDTTVKFFGVDFDKADTLYSNAMLYVAGEAGGETSGAVSEEESSEIESTVESTVESSEVESKTESSTTAAESSEAEDENEGLGWWIWLIIGVVVVAIAVVVVIVLKKKKQ